MNPAPFDENYWNSRYKDEKIGWDIGAASPPLVAYFEQLADRNISILIPGCGNAHEAEYLLDKGFNNITLLDISPMLVEHLKKKFKNEIGNRIHIFRDDFFNFEGKFDLIIEQTFFCSFKPALREKYSNKVFDLLNNKGKLTGLLFDRMFNAGPPFGGSKLEYKHLFESKFHIHTMETCSNSISPREGTELFFILQKK